MSHQTAQPDSSQEDLEDLEGMSHDQLVRITQELRQPVSQLQEIILARPIRDPRLGSKIQTRKRKKPKLNPLPGNASQNPEISIVHSVQNVTRDEITHSPGPASSLTDEPSSLTPKLPASRMDEDQQ